MRKTLAVLLLFLCSLGAFAKGGHRSHSTGPRSHSARSSSSSGKTVHVRSYTRKNGTHVKAYNRRPPGTANSKHKK
jgi:hypothetical protein